MIPAAVTEALAGLPRPVCAYVYDPAVAVARVAALRAALPAGSRVCYAVKANGHPRLLAALAPVVDGFEVASGGELALAVQALAGRDGLLLFAGPAKTDAELAAAVAAGAVVNVESALELRRLAATGGSGRVRCCLRVNRAEPAPAGSHAMTGTPTQFGIDEADLPAVVALARELGLTPEGFHLHAVSNSLDSAAYAAFAAGCVRWAWAAAARFGLPEPVVNVGGGPGVDYTGGTAFDPAGLRAVGAPVVLEPGRYVAAPAGWYAAEVIDLKRTHGRWFAVLRGGTHHFRLPAAWGYSHPFTVVPVDRWNHPFPRPGVAGVRVDVAGELCTPRDVLARDAQVERLRVGDVVVFGDAGAYGWDISHHDFLRHPYPDTVFI